jgi:hypothetical protein
VTVIRSWLARRRTVAPLLVVATLLSACSEDKPAVQGQGGTGTTVADGGPPPTAPPPARLAWAARANAPAARQEVGAALVDGKVWVVGGLNASGTTARVDSYDPAANRWAQGPDLPVALHHLAVAAFRGELVVVGGFQASSGDLYSRPSDRVFALRGGAWVDLPPLRRPRGASAAAVVAGILYVTGGRDTGQLIAPTEAFDGTSWRDVAPLPAPRDHLGAVSDGRYLFAVGGRYLSPARTADAFERYDPVADTWTALSAMPTARGGLGVAFLDGKVIATGGEDASDVFPQSEVFDVVAGSWSALDPMPTPRHGHALVAAERSVYALVGGTRAGVAPSAAAEALAPS